MKYVLVAFFLTGCFAPVPDGRTVDGTNAVNCVLRAIHWVSEDQPKIVMVQPQRECFDGTKGRIRGFVDEADGLCVYGMEYRGDIFLTEQIGGLFSDTSLSHEILHFLGKNHPTPGNWNPNDPEWWMILAGNMALRSEPQSNRIPQ